MRIGILTFHDQLNYGGVLQAFALREKAAELSKSSVEMIHLWHDPRDATLLGKEYNPNVPIFSQWRNRLKAKKRPHGRVEFANRRKKTKELIYSKLNLSKEVYRTARDLKKLPLYDTVIFGSDQVWNPFFEPPTGAPEKNAYLGTFLPETQKRVAYAASFGVSDLPSEMYKPYQRQLEKFSYVTIREASGATLFQKIMGGEKPDVVLDPTLLLSPEQWRSIVSTRPRPTKPYLLSYWLGSPSKERLDWLEALSDCMGIPIVLLVARPQKIDLEIPGKIMPCYDADPFDFVALIEGCEGIVTDSFHGMIFATLFEKKGAFILPSDPANASGPSRFTDFLKRYEINDAIYDAEKFIAGEIPVESLKLAPLKVNQEIFQADRTRSLMHLEQMLLNV